MKKHRGFIILFMMATFTLLYLLIITRPFIDEKYTQTNIIKYYLMTPKPLKQAPKITDNWYFTSLVDEGSGLQISTLVFEGVKKQDVQNLKDRLNAFIDNYPERHDMMSVSEEEEKGEIKLLIIHYEKNDDK